MLLILIAVSTSLVQGDEVVMTTSGPVQGVTIESEGILVEAFLGIPYAEPPVGRLRFEKPVPKTPWKGVHDASRLPPSCIQNVTSPDYYTPDISNMSEDCLYLNIWVPPTPLNDTKLKTVLFFIHGGAYVIGSSNMKLYNGDKLSARGDVVTVTVNYRLGAMGFFFALIDNEGGNMGFRDMILALEWIRSNAVSFHGDPENIVLIGESAGAISATTLSMSPLSKHMVKRVIVQSGSPMMTLTLDKNVRLFKVSEKFATLVGCADKRVTLANDPRKVIKCLKGLPATKIAQAEGKLMVINPLTFIPRMDDDILPINSVQMIRNGDLNGKDMLIGITKDEGPFFLAAAAPQYFGVHGSDPATISKHMSSQLTRIFNRNLDVTNVKEVADFYVNSVVNGTSEKYLQAISESVGDLMVTCGSLFQAEFHSLSNPSYFYMFSHRPDSSPLADWMGVTHFDELQYVFGNPLFENFTEDEKILSDRIMKRWISFAKTGNPNIQDEVEWPLFSQKNPLYLEIDMKERVQSRPDNYRCEFWRERFQAVLDNAVVQRLRSSSTVLTAETVYSVMLITLVIIYKL